MGAEGPLKQRKARGGRFLVLLQLAILSAIFWCAGTYVARRHSTLSQLPASTASPQAQADNVHDHPIPKLMADAEDAFRAKLRRQSKSLGEAVAEYRRRYGGRDPPRGFDSWYAYATKHKFVLVDEFDAIDEDLRPFRALSGRELRRRVDQVGHLPSISLVRVADGKVEALNLENNVGQDREVNARAHGFRRMIEKVGSKLPDMDFPINGKAEGRILVPWEHQEYPEMSVQDSSVGVTAMLGNNFTADWRGQGSVWESWRRTCPPFSKARRHFASMKSTDHARRHGTNLLKAHPHLVSPSNPDPAPSQLDSSSSLHFAPTVDSAFDFCAQPAAHYQQGHFFSDWRTLPALFPVFSPARARGYADVRIPSHYYHQATRAYAYGWDALNGRAKPGGVDDAEVPWAEKRDRMFWRGATTGGGNNPAGFQKQYQRHRLVRMASAGVGAESGAENVTIVFPSPPSLSPSAAAPSALHFLKSLNPRAWVKEPAAPYTTARVPLGALNAEIMDVAFVRAAGGRDIYPGGRAALRKEHRFAQPVPLGEHWKYKYLVDVDGMGYSGRFFAFLASGSVPVKATVYDEFFADWLQPWLHYIPLSQNYDELYNIFAFFSGPTPSMLKAANLSFSSTSDGDAAAASDAQNNENQILLRRIARAGQEWKRTIGRTIDMEIYVYRLALEWARLWADDREAMSFRLPTGEVKAGV